MKRKEKNAARNGKPELAKVAVTYLAVAEGKPCTIDAELGHKATRNAVREAVASFLAEGDPQSTGYLRQMFEGINGSGKGRKLSQIKILSGIVGFEVTDKYELVAILGLNKICEVVGYHVGCPNFDNSYAKVFCIRAAIESKSPQLEETLS